MSPAPHETPDVFLVSADGGGGLSREQARGAGFVSTSRGVRVRRHLLDDPDVRARAALIGCRADATLSDLSAAFAWGLPVPPWLGLADSPPTQSVAVPAGTARPRRPGVRGRRLLLPPEHLTEEPGVQLTTPARTWLDCSALMPLEYVVAMGDAVLSRGLATVEDLERMVRWGRRRRGVAVARRALAMLDAAAESPGESLTRVALVVGGIRPPRCNVDIVVRGEWLARADIAWVAERVIVEYDGSVHNSEQARRSDAARRNLLQDAGWLVIVFTARDLKQPWAMCALVSAALRERAHLAQPR